jgi:hypothetical protein
MAPQPGQPMEELLRATVPVFHNAPEEAEDTEGPTQTGPIQGL